VQTVSNDNFGPLIAYLVPGATVLASLSPYSGTLRGWFSIGTADAPTVGGFLFLTVAALAAGMTVSAVRWAVVDPALRLTGLPEPAHDFSRLAGNLDAVRFLTEVHYHHYLFYANMAVACAGAYAATAVRPGLIWPNGWAVAAFVALEFVLLAAARDALAQHRRRTAQVLGHRPPRRRTDGKTDTPVSPDA
jgi:hypothetical protein